MTLATRLEQIRQRIEFACHQAGRSPSAVTLVAVSKTHPAEMIIEAARSGQAIFGESYIQEVLPKQDYLATCEDLTPAQKNALRWHFIGHLQSRKARDAAGRFELIHSVDSPRLAQALHKRMEQLAEESAGNVFVNNLAAQGGIFEQAALVQVNVGREEQKSGIPEADLPALLEQMQALPRLKLRGLMCIPPFDGTPESARPYFARLRELRDEMELKFGKGTLPELSMGMSQDFEIAIAEGATIVRVGTDIFGERRHCGQNEHN